MWLYGKALEEDDQTDQAIKIYNAAFGAYASYPEWTAQCVEAGFNLGYTRNYETPEETQEKKLQAYKFLRTVIYSWQRMEDGKYEALDRVRRLQERVEGEMQLSQEQIKEIETQLGIAK